MEKNFNKYNMKDKDLEKFLDVHKEQLVKLSMEYTPVFIELFKSHGIQGVVESAYQTLDDINEKSGLNERSTCSSGCHFCCYGEIFVGEFEASYICSFIDQFKIPINKEHVEKQTSKPFHRLKYADKKCSMIDSEGKCSIYNIRPFICRIHNSSVDPKRCDESNGTPNSEILRTVESLAIITAVFNVSSEYGFNKETPNISLGNALKQLINKEIK